MTPRNPEDSPEVDLQNRVLQDIRDTPNDDTHAAPACDPHSMPAATSQQESAVDTKLRLDRLEAYLRGPTVFSA